MIISSRTPEGDANRCPICRHHVRLEPSIDTRDAPCPHCGHLLWLGVAESKNKAERFEIDLACRETFGADELVWKLIATVGEMRFGPLDDNTRIGLTEHESKFSKVEIGELLFELNSWEELVSKLERVSP